VARRPDAARLAVWRSFLATHRSVVHRLRDELVEHAELPLDWYDVLVGLQESGGARRMQDLAAALDVDKSSLSRRVDRMAEAGLVERQASPDDLRGTLAALTPHGRAVLKAAGAVHLRGVYWHFTQHLSDSDVVALRRIFTKVLAGMEGDDER
jgi:DNA-binding MarR family transcriptional regulator